MGMKSFLTKAYLSVDVGKRLQTELDKARHDRLDHATTVETIEATIAGNKAQLEGENEAIKICERRIARLLNEIEQLEKQS